jgi:chromosome segregation ATPase
MAQPADHEARITSLEDTDRAVADLRAEIRDFREHNTRLHNATREDIRDLRQDVTDVRQDVTDLRQDHGDLRRDHTDLRSQVDAGFMEMRGKFDATATGLQQIVGMLTTLIERDSQ